MRANNLSRYAYRLHFVSVACQPPGVNTAIIPLSHLFPRDESNYKTLFFIGNIGPAQQTNSTKTTSSFRLKSTAELEEVQPIALAPAVDVIPSWRPASSVSRRHRKLTDPSDPPSEKRIQPIYVGESVSVLENDSTKIAWKNIYLFPEHRRFRIKNTDVRFDVLDGPTHGELRINEDRVATFTYDDIIARRLEYVHDGSESTEDSFDITVGTATLKASLSSFWRPSSRVQAGQCDSYMGLHFSFCLQMHFRS